MKKLLLTALIAGMSATPAFAAPYVSGSVGLGFAGNSSYTQTGGTEVKDFLKWKSGVPFGGAIGIKQDEFRVEAALGYQTHDLDKVLNNTTGVYESATGTGNSFSVLTYMANGYYDIDLNKSSVSPYVMGGLGGASLKPKDKDSTSKFAWQVGAGVGIKAAKDLTVDLGIRHLKPGSGNDGTRGKFSVSYTNILAGIRYDFQ
ncbi:MAG: outer membrane beta-barrel protein [Chlorobiaceae bacterium]